MKKPLVGLLSLVALVLPAEARKAYVETHWNGITATSQTIKLMNGSTQVGTVTTSAKGIGDTGSNVATSVAPVYPTGGYSSSGTRSYGCKTVGSLQPTDQVKVYNGGYRQWSDFPETEYVEGWSGHQTRNSTTDSTVVYTTASDADPIFDVYNNKLNYSSSSFNGPYDCNYHSISVSVGTGGCSVEYSTDNSSWSSTNPSYKDIGTRTVYYRIKKDGQYPVSGSETVTIYTGTIGYTATGWSGYYDGASHGITVNVTNPSSPSNYTKEYSLNGTSWTTANPTFKEPGEYKVYYRITASGYNTVNGSADVKIIALKKIAYSAPDRTVTYTGGSFGIIVSVTDPASGYQIRYSNSKDGYYSPYSYNSYSQVGSYTVWFQITATGYETVKDSAVLTITPKQLGPGDIDNPSYTNYTYSGHQPWYDTSWYTVHYGTNYWGHGWWWAVFHGTNNYTGVVTNWFHVLRKDVTITSGSKSRSYTGSPLTYDYVYSSGFVSGEGLASYVATGSQTEVGYSPNYFTYKLKANTNPDNYNISVVTGRLTVTAITPVSLKYPVRMEVAGTNRITVGVQEAYRSRVTYSDGSTEYVSSAWALAPDDGLINKSFSGSSAYLKAYPAGAGSVHTLSASFSKSYDTAAMVTNGLVAWYPFDGSTSDRGFYRQSLSCYSSYYVTYVKDRTESDSRALRFAGNSYGYAYATSPSAICQMTNALTISAWVKPEDYGKLGLTYSSGQFALRFRKNEWLFNDTAINCSKALVANAWQHVTLTWDGKALTAYLDGVKVGSATLSKPLGSGTGYFYVGRAVQNSATEYFQGAVDDLRLFNRALTADEIALIKSGADVISASSTISVSDSKAITVEPHCRIPVAVDVESATGSQIGSTAFSFTAGCTAAKSAGWFGQYAVNSGIHDDDYDYDAAQSGKFKGPGTSWMQTTTSGAGTLTFWWKTDCEATYDYLVFKDSGKELARLSGTNDWRQMTFSIPNGAHTFRWEYVKDGQNDVGADAAWVDRMVWTKVDVPVIPTGKSTLVTATDGTYDNYVYVYWDEPTSEWTITGYRVLRKVTGAGDGTYTNLSDVVTARAFTDMSAEPGVAYTYKVEAQNAAGWGSCGTDAGYRGVLLTIDPLTHHFSNVPTGEFAAVTVVSNAMWKAVPNSSWLHATASNGFFVVTADSNPCAYRRSGEITVHGGLYPNGSTLPHSVSRTFSVTQSASVDIGFEYPYDFWRTQLQVTSTNAVAGYQPVSVFTVNEPLRISFGWKDWSDVDVELPAVKFKVYTEANGVALSWIDSGVGVAEGRALAKNAKAACGFWNADQLKVLPPGDYMLEAELDPENLLEDPIRSNNKAVFRFAIRDPSLDFGKDVFFASCWTNLVASNGNDYAQAPHVAQRTIEIVTNDAPCVYEAAAVQFGPYVPMNGVNGQLIEKKKPVDIVFLIDYTGSMDACIAGLMNNIGNFIDQLMIGDSVRGISPIEDLRIKIVGFSDYRSDCTYKNWMKEYEFTTDRKLLKQQLNELKSQCYGGGGNGGESSYDALWYVCKGWSTVWNGATKPTAHVDTVSPFRSIDEAARAVVLFTDEPPHVPMDAPGCSTENNVAALDALLKAESVNLTIIGDGWYYQQYPEYKANIHWLADLVNLESDRKKRKLEETYPKTLADFTQDTSALRSLAETIVLQVPTIATVVEPSFAAAVRGEGALTFRWCNESTTVGTNNTFAFYGDTTTNLVRYGTTGRTWRDEKILFNGDGLHPLKWTYRKLGYEGDVSDCGLVTDVMWTPRKTELEITPAMGTVDWLGTNEVQMTTQVVDGVVTPCKAYGATYDVKCNSIWKVIDHSDWVSMIQDNGEGDGSIVVTVTTNSTYAQRTGFITVEAGEYGTAAGVVTQTVHVLQNPMPYVENGKIQILSVGVKPRWPWNETVDIDFRVITPAKEGTPVKVSFVGVNEEWKDVADMYPAFEDSCEVAPSAKNLTGATNGYAICPTSGLYRVSWNDMNGDWAAKYSYGDSAKKIGGSNGLGWDASKHRFHTPAFSVRVKAECEGKATVELPSDPVRVDMRITGWSREPDDPTVTGFSGGAILTGMAMIGHPEGRVDPKAYDTTDKTLFASNGWNKLDFVERLDSDVYSNRYDRACVINDEAYIEGGVISNDTVWLADKVHVVRDNVFVRKEARLTIEDGATVKFCNGTYLFIYKDPKGSGESEYNICVKGSYWTCGFDSFYGGNTLYHAHDKNEWDNGNDAHPLISNSSTLTSKNFVRQVGNLSSKAVNKTYLQCQQGGTWVSWNVRYYSRNQRWGNLPHPSEDGKEFFGWYDTEVNTKITSPEAYASSKWLSHMITANSLPNQGLLDVPVYALFREPGWADGVGGNQCPPIDASSGTFDVLPDSVVYDGQPHKPSISAIRIGAETLNCAPDYGEYEYGFVTSGVYGVSAELPSSHANSSVMPFRISPRPVDGGEVVVSPTSAPYRPNWDGGVALPSVKVMLPMGKDGAMVEIPAADRDYAYAHTNWYDLVQDATHYWPRPGTYHVEVKFNGNYSGTLTNEFVIEKNSEYDFTSSRYAKTTAEEAIEAAAKGAKRILYFAGEEPEDSATAHMKSLITDDIDTNEWVIANFVCWTDNAESEAFAKYSEGLDAVCCPLICVLNPHDIETPIVRTCGYQTKEQLMDFLVASLTAPVDASAAKIAFRTGKGSFVYNDAVQTPAPGDLLVTYADKELSADKYDLMLEDDKSEDVGTYGVWARIKPGTWVGSYLITGETAAVSYSITPCEVYDGMSPAIRARLGLGLNPPAAVYNNSVQQPAVTSVVAYASAPDYAPDDWFNVGTHTVKVRFDGNYKGTVSETFAITARVVSATVVLDRWEAYVSSKETESQRPSVLRVYDASQSYDEDIHYTVHYGPGEYKTPGTNTITVTFCGNYSGTATATFVIKAVGDVSDKPGVEDDPGAVVTGDASSGYVVTPSAGKNEVTVTIPSGVSPSKVTVRLSPQVCLVTPKGAGVLICRDDSQAYNITNCLDYATDGDTIILSNATVKAEIVEEMLDTTKGAKINLAPDAPSISIVTRAGLLYSFREGETLDDLKTDMPETHVGDGKTWSVKKINVKGGSSAFYGLGVEK